MATSSLTKGKQKICDDISLAASAWSWWGDRTRTGCELLPAIDRYLTSSLVKDRARWWCLYCNPFSQSQLTHTVDSGSWQLYGCKCALLHNVPSEIQDLISFTTKSSSSYTYMLSIDVLATSCQCGYAALSCPYPRARAQKHKDDDDAKAASAWLCWSSRWRPSHPLDLARR